MKETHDFGRSNDNGSHDKKPEQSPRHDSSGGGSKDSKEFWYGVIAGAILGLLFASIFW